MSHKHSISPRNFISSLMNKSFHQAPQSWPSRHSLTSMGSSMWVGDLHTPTCITHSQHHPIILHGKSTLCHKLMYHNHVALGHCGPSLLLSSVGIQLNIVGARRLARTTYRSCVVCQKATARTQQQLMGQLPSLRITPAPPFSTCGIDYAGPFLIKKGHTRRPVIVKCYFICFATKAVHLEPVSDATTCTFIECLKRFVSRRGCPAHIYSDNGGKFVGARGELRELFHMLNHQDTTSAITTNLLEQRVQTSFWRSVGGSCKICQAPPPESCRSTETHV